MQLYSPVFQAQNNRWFELRKEKQINYFSTIENPNESFGEIKGERIVEKS